MDSLNGYPLVISGVLSLSTVRYSFENYLGTWASDYVNIDMLDRNPSENTTVL